VSVPIPPSVQDSLVEVCDFFGIDLEWNRHIFAHAARDNVAAFGSVVNLMAAAVREDRRHGVGRRMRIEAVKSREQKTKGQRPRG
jgi:hypothetical protein